MKVLIPIFIGLFVVGCGSSEAEIALVDAASSGNIGEVKLHLAAGTSVNAKSKSGCTALHYAARGGYNELVVLLVQKGADLHAKDDVGISPFHPLVRSCSKKVVELCINKGVNVNMKADHDSTPLHYAVQNKRADALEIVELLVANGADVNAKDEEGGTPLGRLAAEIFYRFEEDERRMGRVVDARQMVASGQLTKGLHGNRIADLLRKHGGKTGEELKAE